MKQLFRLVLFFCMFSQGLLRGQLNIIGISVQPFNITPEALLNINVMNGGNETQVQTTTEVLNSQGAVLMRVKSQVFMVKNGLNSGLSGERKVASTAYMSSRQADYLKTTHNLPSGRYKFCCVIKVLNGSNETDAFCDELEADFNQYLYLVSPFDGDTIETKNPILSWAHSEPFSILNQGEFYRMVVTEQSIGQSPEEATTVNTPVMVKNYLQEHQLQYPVDARELKEGKRYAWQVQKMGDGVVINKTEAWTFNLRKENELKSTKYVVPKRKPDGSFYNAHDGMVYFMFSEEYKTSGHLKFTLKNSRLKPIEVTVRQDDKNGAGGVNDVSLVLKVTGTNLYELDMNSRKLESGFYTLEITNEKNELFYLRIFLP